MVVTQDKIAQIVADASSLLERLNNGIFKIDDAQAIENQLIDERLDHWCQVIAQGNREKFQQRLQWDGWNIETVRPMLGAVCLTENQALPSWAETLREIMQIAQEFVVPHNIKFPIDPENPLPFEDVLLPALLVARQQLLKYLKSASFELVSESAYLSLERGLLQELVNLAMNSLEFEFFRSRPLGCNLLSLLIGEGKETPSKAHYNAFVQNLLHDGLLALFQKYPVLGRLIATTIDFWVEATAEFLQRLKEDLSDLQQEFNQPVQSENQKEVPNTQLEKVSAIAPNLSDPHNRGRSVIALTFESGLKVVYKPRNLGLEVAFTQFLDWCNQYDIPLAFKVLKVLDRSTYGWVEYIEQQPCSDEAAAKRFYQRAGMLLCLLYVLGGTDCHSDNLIASGEHLVLVDMETLTHHEAKPLEDSLQAMAAQTSGVNQQFWATVMRTGLLPRWQFSPDNRIAYDMSALGGVESQRVPWGQCWKSVNTDNMHRVSKTQTLEVSKNVPMLNGVALSPNDYLGELVSGFRQMYRFLIQQREALLADPSPLMTFQAQRVRFLFRATEIYFMVLQTSLAPEFLRNGVDRSIELDVLSRAFLVTQDQPRAWGILQGELRAIEQLDIPLFGASSNSDALTMGLESPIEQYFQAPSFSEVISRLQKLDEADLPQQVGIVQGAFYAMVARTAITEPARKLKASTFTEADFSQITPLTPEQLLQRAEAIAQEIYRTALWAADGSVNWIGLGYISNAERFQLMPLGENLYDGNCGITLFLAAWERVTGSTQFRDLALAALQPLGQRLHADGEAAQRMARRIGIGGAAGLGSIVYSLVRISQFLEKATLLEDALLAANLITAELIAADQQFDVMSGAAGAILGLLALYADTGELTLLDKAIACGQHLLEHRLSVDNSPRAWKTLEDKKPLTGFSHGVAGIAYSLLRLYGVTQDNAYLEAAGEGIAYERSVFSEAAANWPDFRYSADIKGQPGFGVSWCNGASGIGLGRLGSLSILETDEIRQDVEVALQTTQKMSLHGVDQICCGNLGRIELLLVAAQKLSCPQLLELSQKQAAWVVARAEQTGAYQLFANLPSHVLSPGFFQGTAGIGYQLLRLAYSETLPSVLLWA